jgi:ubiquinone/menaquinone biosynthesis C-methylase UbiE
MTMEKLNLGCGIDIKKNWTNADKVKTAKNVVKLEMEKKFPFKNNYFDEVYARHSIEHSKDVIFTFKEIHRICKQGAKVTIIVPHCSLVGAMADLNHFQEFNFYTLDKFEPKNKREYLYDFNFKIIKKEFSKTVFPFTKWFFNSHPHFSEKFLSSIFPIEEITYELKVVKSD